MGYFDNYHIFRDPVHGFIKVYDIERDIINSKAFQRLRRIKQLALTCLVYHGAEHTRFGHSLGVMEVASRIFDTIHQKDKSSGDNLLTSDFGWNDDDLEKYKIILRLWALLHDIGYCPFSHAADGLFEQKMDHEKMGSKIIREECNIKDIINSLETEYGINTQLISNLVGKITPKDPSKLDFPFYVIKQIIDGPLDADKIDYLWRDSIYTGVYYGRFDIERLINTMVIAYNKVRNEVALGIEEGGKYVAESLILSRYYMFTQVYFHEIRRAYDQHLTSFLSEYLKGSCYSSNVAEFLKTDDNKVFQFLYKCINTNNSLGKKSKIILDRKHYEVLKETTDSAEIKEVDDFKYNFYLLQKKFQDIEIFIDSADDAPNKFDKKTFLLKLKNPPDNKPTSRYVDIETSSDIIKQLKGIIINKFRIYVPKSRYKKIKKESDTLNWSN